MVMFLCGGSGGFITGENITVDGGMSRLMIYHGEHGVSKYSGIITSDFRPKPWGEAFKKYAAQLSGGDNPLCFIIIR